MRTRAKVLAAILCTVAALTTSGGTYVSASSEAADAKTEVTIGFSSDGDSFDPCTGFGYTGSPLYSNLVKVNGEVDERRGRKVYEGDVVSYDGKEIKVIR